MAVTRVYELVEKRERSRSGLRTETRYRRMFRVVTDDIKDGPQTVSQAAGIPRIRDIYSCGNETDSGSICIDVKAEQTSGGEDKIWDVTAEYSSSTGAADAAENPLDQPAQIQFSFAQFQRVVDRDLDNKPLVNSAHQPFDPPIQIDDSRPVLVITRNEPTFDGQLAMTYQDAINEDSFMGFPPFAAKIANISANKQSQNTIEFWEVTYEIHFRRDLWHPLKVLDQGYYQLVDSGGVKVRQLILDKDNKAITAPALLNGSGVPISITSGGALASDPVFLEFNVFKKLPFAPLNLP